MARAFNPKTIIDYVPRGDRGLPHPVLRVRVPWKFLHEADPERPQCGAAVDDSRGSGVIRKVNGHQSHLLSLIGDRDGVVEFDRALAVEPVDSHDPSASDQQQLTAVSVPGGRRVPVDDREPAAPGRLEVVAGVSG